MFCSRFDGGCCGRCGEAGGGRDFDPVHRAVDGGADAEHAAEHASSVGGGQAADGQPRFGQRDAEHGAEIAGSAGRGRRKSGRRHADQTGQPRSGHQGTGHAGGEQAADGQPRSGHRGGGVHHVVHARVRVALFGVAQQVEVLQGRHERDRPVGHPALLRVVVPHRVQHPHGPVPGRAARGADLSHHAHLAHPETGAPLDRSAEFRLHAAQFVQRARPAHVVLGHGRAHLLVAVLLCRKGRAQLKVHQHPRNLLVGRHHHDDGRLRRHLPRHGARKGCRERVLHLRRPRHCLAHSHRRQQLH